MKGVSYPGRRSHPKVLHWLERNGDAVTGERRGETGKLYYQPTLSEGMRDPQGRHLSPRECNDDSTGDASWF
jgi:hypothetical protein